LGLAFSLRAKDNRVGAFRDRKNTQAWLRLKVAGNVSLCRREHRRFSNKSILFGGRFRLAKRRRERKIPKMTSTVTSKGQTVVPKALRERFNIKSGATLDRQEDGQSLRVVKLEARKTDGFFEGLRRLGRVPAGRRDKRPLKPIEEE
jgi:AbrB family looped-hinge helix DNA binding protein